MSATTHPGTTNERLPGVLRLGLVRAGYEIRGYFRQGDSLVFTFLFPTIMFLLFSVAFSSTGDVGADAQGNGGVSIAAYYLPGLVAAGILLSGIQNLAIDVAQERSDGTLKRLAGTPLPVLSYFIGKFGQVLVTAILQVALLLTVAAVGFDVALPTEAAAWGRFAAFFLLGIAASAALGIAMSRLPRSGKSASAVIVPILLVLQFISGVYLLPFTQLPDYLQTTAGLFPLRWIALGMRSALLPDELSALETGGTWQTETALLNVAIWLVVGVVVSVLTFRWNRKDT